MLEQKGREMLMKDNLIDSKYATSRIQFNKLELRWNWPLVITRE